MLAHNTFCTSEHGGTHLDAPYHFYKDGIKVADIPIEKLIAKGTLIDISKDVELNGHNASLTIDHLENFIKTNGIFDKNTVLLVKFNWSQYWNDRQLYMGIDSNDNYNFPGIDVEAAYWIANNSNIVGIGVDTASVDKGSSKDFLVHQILSKSGLYFIENVKLVTPLPAKNFNVIVMPVKIKEGTGAPVRIVAIPNNELYCN